jgi:propanol-preferring alcohol dehydrogenase
LCTAPLFTGWDLDGGYAQYVVVDERYAYALTAAFSDEEAAPLLCAGIIGYPALRRSNLPKGGSLGIYGFGGSAHLTAQIALFEGARVHVFTRSSQARALALDLGATSVGEADAHPPIRPSRSIPPSSLRPSGAWFRPPSPPSIAAALWPLPAYTSAIFRY